MTTAVSTPSRPRSGSTQYLFAGLKPTQLAALAAAAPAAKPHHTRPDKQQVRQVGADTTSLQEAIVNGCDFRAKTARNPDVDPCECLPTLRRDGSGLYDLDGEEVTSMHQLMKLALAIEEITVISDYVGQDARRVEIWEAVLPMDWAAVPPQVAASDLAGWLQSEIGAHMGTSASEAEVAASTKAAFSKYVIHHPSNTGPGKLVAEEFHPESVFRAGDELTEHHQYITFKVMYVRGAWSLVSWYPGPCMDRKAFEGNESVLLGKLLRDAPLKIRETSEGYREGGFGGRRSE